MALCKSNRTHIKAWKVLRFTKCAHCERIRVSFRDAIKMGKTRPSSNRYLILTSNALLEKGRSTGRGRNLKMDILESIFHSQWTGRTKPNSLHLISSHPQNTSEAMAFQFISSACFNMPRSVRSFCSPWLTSTLQVRIISLRRYIARSMICGSPYRFQCFCSCS